MKFLIPLAKSEDPKNYKHALEVARKNLIEKNPSEIEEKAGVKWDSEKYSVKSFNDKLEVFPSTGKVYLASENKPVTFTLQLVSMNYLARANGKRLTFEKITFRELPGANSYFIAFQREAITPILRAFEKDKKVFQENCLNLGGNIQEGKADYSVTFWPLPKVYVALQLWEGDEEIPGNCNILFDKSTSEYLHTEDVAALSELIARIIS